MRHRVYLLRLKGGEIMNESAHNLQAVNSGLPEAHTIYCTLYDLIELGKVRCANGDAIVIPSDRFIW